MSYITIPTFLNRLLLSKRKPSAYCCGIVAFAGDTDCEPILTDGVTLLQNRGYDSCGIATVSGGKISASKFASKGSTCDSIQLLQKTAPKKHKGHNLGIAHTRWATHGAKTDVNAHPHLDWKSRIALVHNGTIDNFNELKSEMLKRGVPFKSETDSEVIANLIGSYLDEKATFQEAVKSAVRRLRGTWGLAIIHKDIPHGLMLARNGSPLIVGQSRNAVFAASEPLALTQYTNEYLSLNDGDVIFVSTKKGIDHLVEGRDLREIPHQEINLEPSPFKHWTIREIYEQPQSLARALKFGSRLPQANQP